MTNIVSAPGVVAVCCIALYVAARLVYKTSTSRQSLIGAAYIIHGSTSHVRFFPVESKHSFTYATFSLLVSLRALEDRRLDLGWNNLIFAYSPPFPTLTSLSPESYLQDGHAYKGMSMLRKLDNLLHERSMSAVANRLGEIWTMTMPGYFGFKGINPLTVHFCYDKSSSGLLLVILEVHNTFGERHVYFLQVGVGEDQNKPHGFSHQWTIPRQFHVSPFNDRSGFYVCAVSAPPYPPHHPHWSASSRTGLTPNGASGTVPDRPHPVVRFHLLVPAASEPNAIAVGMRETTESSTSSCRSSIPMEKKFSALHRTTFASPLSSCSLCSSLLWTPFALFLTFPRIAYEAFRLHYLRRLDVYQRPEPVAASSSTELSFPAWNRAERSDLSKGGTIGWRPSTWAEEWARRRFIAYVANRPLLADKGRRIRVELHSMRASEVMDCIPLHSPSVAQDREPSDESKPASLDERILRITYKAPRLFTLLVLSSSPQHALLAGSLGDYLFSTSDDTLFCELLFPPLSMTQSWGSVFLRKCAAWIRDKWSFQGNLVDREHEGSSVPNALDYPGTIKAYSVLIPVLFTLYLTDWFERRIFTLIGARFVPGDEPWNISQRAQFSQGQAEERREARSHIEQHRPLGSARRA